MCTLVLLLVTFLIEGREFMSTLSELVSSVPVAGYLALDCLGV